MGIDRDSDPVDRDLLIAASNKHKNELVIGYDQTALIEEWQVFTEREWCMSFQEAGSQWDIRPWMDGIVACLWGTLVLGIIALASVIYRRVRRKLNATVKPE